MRPARQHLGIPVVAGSPGTCAPPGAPRPPTTPSRSPAASPSASTAAALASCSRAPSPRSSRYSAYSRWYRKKSVACSASAISSMVSPSLISCTSRSSMLPGCAGLGRACFSSTVSRALPRGERPPASPATPSRGTRPRGGCPAGPPARPALQLRAMLPISKAELALGHWKASSSVSRNFRRACCARLPRSPSPSSPGSSRGSRVSLLGLVRLVELVLRQVPHVDQELAQVLARLVGAGADHRALAQRQILAHTRALHQELPESRRLPRY